MSTTKIINNFFLSIILLITLSIVDGETGIPFRNTIKPPQNSTQLGEEILIPNLFQMNHSFSLSTSIINGTSYTAGIYSNISNYNVSKNIDIKMGLHLIQKQNMQYFSSRFQPELGYELNLEYKLSPYSFFNLQISNYNNAISPF